MERTISFATLLNAVRTDTCVHGKGRAGKGIVIEEVFAPTCHVGFDIHQESYATEPIVMLKHFAENPELIIEE